MIYLASPYSHPNTETMHIRFVMVCKAAAYLMRRGELVFSPIAHTHPIAVHGALPTGWDYWEKYDRAMLAACGSLTVFMLPGWEESKGVVAEIKIAEELGKPVTFWNPAEETIP